MDKPTPATNDMVKAPGGPSVASAAKLLPTERIWELDFVRGFCVLLMICDHVLFDLGFVFLSSWFPDGGSGVVYGLCHVCRYVYWDHPLRMVVHVLVIAGFIASCGISCSFSRSNVKRGLRLLLVAVVISGVTWLMDSLLHTNAFFIRFGVLHMLAISILVYSALRPLGLWPSLLGGVAVVIAGWCIDPSASASTGFIPFALGLTDKLPSGDYFPLIPWLGWLLIGAALGAVLYKNRRSFFPGKGKAPALRPILWMGRHALLVYIIHQPVIYGFLFLLGLIFG